MFGSSGTQRREKIDLYPRRVGFIRLFWLPVLLGAGTLLALATLTEGTVRDRLDTESLLLILLGWTVLSVLIAQPTSLTLPRRGPVVSLTDLGVRLYDRSTKQFVEVSWAKIDQIYANRIGRRTTLWIEGSLGRLGPLALFEIVDRRRLADINAELQRILTERRGRRFPTANSRT
jgi:hypothetical protein